MDRADRMGRKFNRRDPECGIKVGCRTDARKLALVSGVGGDMMQSSSLDAACKISRVGVFLFNIQV